MEKKYSFPWRQAKFAIGFTALQLQKEKKATFFSNFLLWLCLKGENFYEASQILPDFSFFHSKEFTTFSSLFF